MVAQSNSVIHNVGQENAVTPEATSLSNLENFIYRNHFLDLLRPLSDVLDETSSDAYFYPFLNEEFWVLVLVDLLKVETIVKQHIIYLPKCSFERAIFDIRYLLLTVPLDGYVSRARNF